MALKPVTNAEQRNFRIIALVYACIALLFTSFRLYVRRRGLWWDDLFATVALVALLGQAAVVVTVTYGVLLTSTPGDGGTPAKVALNYMNAITYLCQDWFARLAILYSIVRITPSDRLTLYLHVIAGFFTVCLLTNVFIFIGYCELHSAWKQSPFVLCINPQAIPIFQIITGIISDTILIILPINTLRMLTSAPAMRRRLMIIFSASALLTIAQIVQAVLTFNWPGVATLVAGLTEGFIAVTVCSLAIVYTGIMQLLGHSTAEKEKNQRERFKLSDDMQFRTSYTDEEYTGSKQIIDDIGSVLPTTSASESVDTKAKKTATNPVASIRAPSTSEPPIQSRESEATPIGLTISFWERWKNLTDVDIGEQSRSNMKSNA